MALSDRQKEALSRVLRRARDMGMDARNSRDTSRRRSVADVLRQPIEQRMAQEEATRGVRGLAPGEQPFMQPEQAAEMALGMVPGVGDAMSVYDTGKALAGGNYTGAALSAVGMLPFVPGLAGTIAKAADDLPMDEASRMARAREMGFDVDAYHGTNSDVFAFDPEIQTRKVRSGAPFGSYSFTDNPLQAAGYAQGKGGNIIPVKLRLNNPMEIDAKGQGWSSVPTGKVNEVWGYGAEPLMIPEHVDINELALRARNAGHDALVVKNVGDFGSKASRKRGDVGIVYMTFDPTGIRSRFAKFDPRKKDSANLLAGVAGGAVLLPAVTQTEEGNE